MASKVKGILVKGQFIAAVICLTLLSGCSLWYPSYVAGECEGRWKQMKQYTPENASSAPQLIGDGYVSSVSVDPRQPNSMVLGTETSGIFYSKNGGKSWENVTDELGLPFLGIQHIARSKTNPDVLIATTAVKGLVNTASYSQGVLQSTDGGRSWQVRKDVAALAETREYHVSGEFGAVCIDDSLAAVAFGDRLLVLSVHQDTAVISEVKSKEFASVLGDKAHISIHSVVKDPFHEHSVVVGLTMYKRADQKDTHTEFFSLNLRGNGTLLHLQNLRFHTALFTAVTSTPEALYFAMTSTQTTAGLPMRPLFELWSYDGESLKSLYTQQSGRYYGGPFAGFGLSKHAFEVLETATKKVFLIGGYEVTTLVSEKGAFRVLPIDPSTHVDVRGLQVVKNAGDTLVFQANDGMVARTSWHDTTKALHWTSVFSKSKNIQIQEVLGLVPFSKKEWVTGEMHNGLKVTQHKETRHLQAGDGGRVVKSKFASHRVYGIIAFGTGAGVLSCYEKDSVGEWQRLSMISIPSRAQLKASSPILTVKDGDMEYVTVGGVQPIRYAFDRNGEYVQREPVVIEHFNPNQGVVTGLAASKQHEEIMYMTFRNEWACPDGLCKDPNVWKSIDGGNSWSVIPIDALQFASPSDVVVDANDKNTAYVSGANLSSWEGVSLGKVYQITHGQAKDLTYGLPNVPVHSITQDAEGRLWIGTEYGVYYLERGATQWKCFSNGLPPSPVMKLAIKDGYLWAATYGRGVWRSKLVF